MLILNRIELMNEYYIISLCYFLTIFGVPLYLNSLKQDNDPLLSDYIELDFYANRDFKVNDYLF